MLSAESSAVPGSVLLAAGGQLHVLTLSRVAGGSVLEVPIVPLSLLALPVQKCEY